MSAVEINTAATNMDITNTKRVSSIQAGLEKMKDQQVLLKAAESLQSLAKTVVTDSSKSFDLFYINMPWKTVEQEYAASLPLRDLSNPKSQTGLLLWVDSPMIEKALGLIKTWGFQFHSVLHSMTYTSPVPVTPTPAETEDADVQAGVQAKTATRKTQTPHGWVVDGLVQSKTRQLWFAVRDPVDAPVDGPSFAFLKDISFVRKRVPPVSLVTYSKASDSVVTGLSSKKKNFENWQIFPDYDVFVSHDIRAAIENIHKPTARVLSLFSDGLNRNWYTWGPNVPGYVCAPMRADCAFPAVVALLKYFSSMKGATVAKYINLINTYAIQLAKQLGSSAAEQVIVENTEDATASQNVMPVILGRLRDFFVDLERRYHEGGNPGECSLSASGTIQLSTLLQFAELTPEKQTQALLLVGQVIRGVQHKNAEATERRKRAAKRRRDAATDEEGDLHAEGAKAAPAERVPRKFGIAAPVGISDELAEFMGLERGSQVARTTVVKFVNEYIKANNLQKPEKRTQINMDEKLLTLLKPSAQFGAVDYFNLCKLLGPHFQSRKETAAADAAGQASEESKVEVEVAA